MAVLPHSAASHGSSSEHPVRTRYAPSPTGFPHIGNYRTAIFEWLAARHSGGPSCCVSRTPIANVWCRGHSMRSLKGCAGSA